MSPIGRIFVVLNLFLAAAFLGWAANTMATSHQWRSRYQQSQDEMATALAEKDTELSAVKTARDEAQREATRLREERDDQKLRADRAEQDLADAQSANAELRANNARFSETVDQIQQSYDAAVADKERAIEARHEAQRAQETAEREREAAMLAQSEAEESLAQAQRRIDDLDLNLAQVGKERDSVQTQLATLVDLTGANLEDITSQRLIEGAVLSAMNDVGLVALNVGEDDQVTRGMTFEIYNGKQYKGRVRIESVRPHMATGRVLNLVDGQTMRQGDSAATRL